MERAIRFTSGDKQLFGIVHEPDKKSDFVSFVLMVVGGPQTRVGSHRLFVQLARKLAEHDIPVMRFDYSGIGDSEGEWRGYKFAGPCIKAAIQYLYSMYADLQQIIIWSLCDGATSSVVFAAQNPDLVQSMILCNPYVHSVQGKARTVVRYYYLRRLLDREFWHKVVSLKFKAAASLKSLFHLWIRARHGDVDDSDGDAFRIEIDPEEFIRSLSTYPGSIRFFLSGEDLTARQFEELCRKREELRKVVRRGQISIRHIPGADHTFTDLGAKRRLFSETISAVGASRSSELKRYVA